MNGTSPTREAIRSLRTTPFAKRVIARWRVLAPKERGTTLIACSGGADSIALLIALASAEPDHLRVGHVRHDMRSEEEARSDEEHVRALAASLRLPFESRAVKIGDGNEEAIARERRYGALVKMARDAGCTAITTGHHADDQLETFLFHAIRGAGPRGLRAIAEQRDLEGVALVRPMLGVTHADAEVFCTGAGVTWREDRTNADRTRTRAALRATVLPALRAIRPDVAQRVTNATRLQRDAQALIEDRAQRYLGDDTEWDRASLAAEPYAVIGEVLRSGAYALGAPHGDTLGTSVVMPAIEAIRDGSTDPRLFEWASGVRVEVTAHRVRMTRDIPIP